METAIRQATMQVTAVALLASAMVLSLGLVGATASLFLVAALLVLSVGLYVSRPDASVGYVGGVDVDSLLSALWLAPLVAAFPLVLELGATPGEMQAIGGLLGLVGMANYFLRPVYLLVYGLVASLSRTPA